MDVIRFENERWSRENQKIFFRHRAALELALHLQEKAGKQEGEILDVGCGDGLFLTILRDNGLNGKGLDISSKAVEKCRSKGLQASVFEPGSVFPYDSNRFDLVTILDVLEHVYEPVELLKECVRVSKGKVIIGVPNFSSFPARLQVLFGQVPENNRSGKGHVYWFNLRVLTDLCRSLGLRVSGFRVNAPWGRIFLVGPVMRFMARIWPNLFALSFVVLAETREDNAGEDLEIS